MRYNIVASESRLVLTARVNEDMEAGWRPIGGVSYAPGVYMQAMYLEHYNNVFSGLFAKPKQRQGEEVYAH